MAPFHCATQRRFVLPALIGLAAIVELYKLGASSWFIDEGNSIAEVHGSLAHLWDGVRGIESSPATYFLSLHYWLELLGSESELAGRLPSALAAVALVPATWWLAELVAPRTYVPALAGVLCAVCPLVQQYGQQARPYALLMLALVLSAAAAIEARRRASGRWLMAAALAAIAALSLHYFAVLVLLPLGFWIARSRELSEHRRVAYAAALTLTFLAWLPLASDQYAHGDRGIGGFGNLSGAHVLVVLGSPFWGRSGIRASLLEPIAAAIVLTALIVCCLPRVRRRLRDGELLLSLTVVPLLGLIAAGLVGKDVLVNRYAAVSVPFALIVIAVAALAAPRGGVRLVAGALVFGVCAVGILKSDQQAGFYADARGALRAVRAGAQRGDLVAYVGRPGIFSPVAVYARELVPRLRMLAPDQWAGAAQLSAYAEAVARKQRIWIVVDDAPGVPPAATSALLPPGYALRSQSGFPADENMRVLLVTAAQP